MQLRVKFCPALRVRLQFSTCFLLIGRLGIRCRQSSSDFKIKPIFTSASSALDYSSIISPLAFIIPPCDAPVAPSILQRCRAACALLREIEPGGRASLVREYIGSRLDRGETFPAVRRVRALNDVWRALLREAGQSMIYEGNSVIAYRSNSRSARAIVKHDRPIRGAYSSAACALS